jgi:group I intron endonuclease
MTGIYLITNLINKKVYIGQTRDLIRRALEHLRCQSSNQSLTQAIEKYGVENFSFGVLSILPSTLSTRRLFEIEDEWIHTYESRNPRLGYNRRDSRTPWPDPTEAKNKIRAALTGRVVTPETRARISQATIGRVSGMKGKHQSKKSRAKALETARTRGIRFGMPIGTKRSPEAIAKTAAANRVHSSKTFVFEELASGAIHSVTGGFDPFCIEHGLSQTMMREVLSGKKQEHRGWRVSLLAQPVHEEVPGEGARG